MDAFCKSVSDTSLLTKADKYFNQLHYDSSGCIYKIFLNCNENDISNEIRGRTVNKYVTCLWRQEEYEAAKELIILNIDFCTKTLGEFHIETANAYKSMGILSFLNGPSGNADAYFTKALSIIAEMKGIDNPDAAVIYDWLGIYHNSISDTILSRKYLRAALKIREINDQTEDYRAGDMYRYMGLFYKRFGQLDSALHCFYKAKKLFDSRYSENNFKSVKCLNNISDVYEIIGEMDKAFDIHMHSLELIKKFRSKNRYTLMMTYFNIGELYGNIGDYQNALLYMQKVLALYFPEINEYHNLSNPNDIGVCPVNIVRVVLAYKARYLKELANQTPENERDLLIIAADCYRLIDEIIKAQRLQINNIEELLLNEHMLSNLYIEMARNALMVYKITNDTIYFSRAITYLSANRIANQILSDRYEIIAAQDCLPIDYNSTRNQLQEQLHELLTQRTNKEKSDPTKEINIRIAEIKIELDLLAHDLAKENYDILYSIFNITPISFSTIQNKLQENQLLIWYNEDCGDYIKIPDSIMIIAFSKYDSRIMVIDGKKAVEHIMAYQALMIEDPHNLQKIDSVGKLVYSFLLSPIEDMMQEKDLIIIPSQHISMIPIDALPDASRECDKRILESYLVWNEFSLNSFLLDADEPKYSEVSILAVAPQFNNFQKEAIGLLTNRDTSLINLPGAIRECIEISHIFDTKLLVGLNASLSEFEANCANHNIIHLSTHGIPDNEEESIIKLVFSDYQQIDGQGSINMFRVLNLPLQADLVVLSACKTGVGEMNKGEGNVNMAWAFNMAGAKSVLFSLWDANDYASSVIMPAFYKNLASGLSKPEALRQAKLDYLRFSDELTTSPYFWAGFEYWGSDSSIVAKGDANQRFIYVSLIILSFLVLVLLLVMAKQIHQAR